MIPVSAEGRSLDAQNSDYFTFAIENLNRLSEFGPTQILTQIVDRLNQWSRIEQPSTVWQLDPLLSTLPDQFQSGALIDNLESLQFDAYDGAYLREAAILHSIAEYVTRDSTNDLSAVEDLFRWTNMHIALDPAPELTAQPTAQMPWQSILLGHGRAIDRAWVFAILARQLDYDVILLYLPDPRSNNPSVSRFWCAGFLHDGDIYLFDPFIGMPLPGPAGGIATLADLRREPQRLRAWDTPDRPYWVTEAALSRVIPFIEASSQSLTKRMKSIQDELGGDYRMRLVASPSRIAERLKAINETERPRIWDWPFKAAQIITDPQNETRTRINREMQAYGKFRTDLVNPLWAGRLQQLAGRYTTQIDGIPRRPRDAPIGEQGAKPLLLASRIMLQKVPKDDIPDDMKAQLELIYERADVIRRDASWNLAMIALDEGNHALAEYYLDEMDKQQTAASWPDDAPARDVTMARARVAEAADDRAKAVSLYERVAGPQKREAVLRIRKLKKREQGTSPGAPQ
ncbi:MAG: hypothetical protein P8K78_08490 [Pirellulales bacterium]|nr:hypothetical protein [Pirellulales bacterium]